MSHIEEFNNGVFVKILGAVFNVSVVEDLLCETGSLLNTKVGYGYHLWDFSDCNIIGVGGFI